MALVHRQVETGMRELEALLPSAPVPFDRDSDRGKILADIERSRQTLPASANVDYSPFGDR